MQRLNTVFVTSLLIACGDNLPEATPSADSSATDVESGSHTSPPHTSTTSSVTDPTSATDCPDDVTCVDTFPTVVSGDTQKGSSRFDSYDCAPDTDESGPEHVYRVDLPEAGFLSLDLIDVASGADVDVHLLLTRDAQDCVDRGHWSAASLLPAGSYWVTADSWVNGAGDVLAGAYELRIGFTTVGDLVAHGLQEDIASDALHAFDEAWFRGETGDFLYGITDFALHSSEPRLWLIDLATGELAWHLHVSHGEGSSDPSDAGWATSFSNIVDSHQSSLGMMRAGEPYGGTFGKSMKLDGLEPGYNDRVRERFIVMHGGEYARPEFVEAYGRLGQSWGCPTLDDRISDDVIDATRDGVLYFFWYPEDDWYLRSEYLPSR